MAATVLVTDELRAEAKELADQFPPDQPVELTLVVNQRDVAVPTAMARFLSQILESLATSGSVNVQSLPEVVSTTIAANMLGISRPTLMKLIRDGLIPSEKVGTHTRLRTTDVLVFKGARSAKQRDAFDAMRKLEDELGLDGLPNLGE